MGRLRGTEARERKSGAAMAIDVSDGSKEMDYAEHIRTFNGFWKAAQIGIVVVALILIAMAATLLH